MKNKIKITGIISSPKKNGNGAVIVREILKSAEKEDAVTTEIFLPEYNIEFCKDCSYCMKEGKCTINDDMEKLKKILYESDGIIINSPVYGFSQSAMLKKFLERFGNFEFLTSNIFGGKYLVGVATAAGMGAEKVAKEIVSVYKELIFKKGYVTGYLGAMIGKIKAKDNKKVLEKAEKLGKKIVKDIKISKTYPLKNILKRTIINLFVKPKMIKFIQLEKEGRMKAIYNNLKLKGCL